MAENAAVSSTIISPSRQNLDNESAEREGGEGGDSKKPKDDGLPWGYKYVADWLPRLRNCNAVLMLMVNIFLPGFGTLFFSMAWLTGKDFAIPTTMKPRWQVASIGILYGIAQIILAPFVFGWAWSIFTGVMAVRQSKWIEIMETREARAQEAMNTIAEVDENNIEEAVAKKEAKEIRRWKLKPAPPPTPEAPPPGWVYRLYPFSSDELRGPDGTIPSKPESQRDKRGSRKSKNRSRSESRNNGGRTTPKNSSQGGSRQGSASNNPPKKSSSVVSLERANNGNSAPATPTTIRVLDGRSTPVETPIETNRY